MALQCPLNPTTSRSWRDRPAGSIAPDVRPKELIRAGCRAVDQSEDVEERRVAASSSAGVSTSVVRWILVTVPASAFCFLIQAARPAEPKMELQFAWTQGRRERDWLWH